MGERADTRGWGPGWPNCQTSKLVTVVLSNGLRLPVRREMAELFRLLCEETIRLGYALHSDETWGFACRAIKGTQTPSNHSWGLAVDINSRENPQRRPLTTNLPPAVVALWKRYGFRWGGDYQHATPDAMHFEYMGTPETAKADTERARRDLQEDDMPLNDADKEWIREELGGILERIDGKGSPSDDAVLPILRRLVGAGAGGERTGASPAELAAALRAAADRLEQP